MLDGVRNNAAQVLSEYADTVIDNAKAGIISEALKGTFIGAVVTNIISGILYTVLLICIALALKYGGIDFLGIFEHTTPAAQTTTEPPPAPPTPPAKVPGAG
jgi:hypothetical protein